MTWTDRKVQPLPSILPFEVKPLSSDGKALPEVDSKRMEWLKEIDLNKDPYYLPCLERRLNELRPRVSIRGQVGISKVQNGNIPAGFSSELYEANDLHCWNTEPICGIICADFHRVEFNERIRVFFDFEYIFLLRCN